MGAANLYSIEPLKRICCELLGRSICVENAAGILQAADTYGVPHLRTTCLSFMVGHFAEVIRTEAFQELVAAETRPLVLSFLEEAASRMRAAADAE